MRLTTVAALTVPLSDRENLKHEPQVTLPTPTRANMFGVSLEELMGFDGEKGGIPRVVKDCIQYLRHSGMTTARWCFSRLAINFLRRYATRRLIPTVAKFRYAETSSGCLRSR